MANGEDLRLRVKATDEATATLKRVNAQIAKLSAPAKLAAAQSRLAAMTSRFAPLRDAAANVGGALVGVGSSALLVGQRFAAFGAMGVLALGGLIHSAVEAGDKLGEVSQRVGMSADAFASLQFAAAQSDVEAEAFTASMDKLNRALGEASAGKGELLSFLQKVSPAFAKQFKSAKSSEEGLALLTDAFARIQDPARRAALATAAFGRGNAQMGVFLSQGSAAIQAQQRRYLELHGSTEGIVKGAGDFDNASRELGVSLTGLRDAVASGLLPVLTRLATRAADFVAKNREGLARWAESTGAAIERWVSGGGLERLSDALGKVAGAVGWVVDKLGPVGTALAAAAVAAGPLLVSLGGLALQVAGFSKALVLLNPPVAAGIAAVGALALAGKAVYDNWGDIKLLFKDLGWWIQDTMTAAWGHVKSLLDLLGQLPGMGKLTELAKRGVDVVSRAQNNVVAEVTGATPYVPLSNVASALPAPRSTEAKVSVDFSNLPRGARVSTDPQSSAPLSLSAGYSMVTP